jgi:hypothetical protein
MGRRRVTVLVVGVLAVLAGCGAEIPDAKYYAGADELSKEQAIEMTTVPVNETIDPVKSAIETGISAETAVRDRLEDRDIVIANGSYYDLNRTVVSELNATRITYSVTVVSNETPDVTARDLSPRDRRMLTLARLLADEVGDEEIEAAHYTNETELRQSALADQTMRVEANGTLYKIEPIDREAESKKIYRYTARRVATDNATYLDYVDERFTVSLSNASSGVQSVFEQLLSIPETDSREAYGELLAALPSERAVDNSQWFVRYNGTRYVVAITADEVFG